MIHNKIACFTFAAACAAALALVCLPRPAGADSGWSAHRNVLQSQRYDRLLETNLNFRKARMHKECGPIGDVQLRQQCLASFSQDEPFVGSSTPRRHYPSSAGR